MQIHFQLKAQGWGAPPPHAKPGNPGGKSRARGIKPHVMFSYVWIYGSKMCTLHTNVSSKTPSRSPQGSGPVVGGDSECLAKIEFLNLGGQLFVRYDCYPNNNEERNWHAAALNWLVSIFVELQALRLFLFSQLNAILAIVRNGWSFCPTHFCLFTIICPSIPPNKGVPSIQMVILPPEPLSRFRNFESEIVPAIAIMTEGRGREGGG